MLVNNIVINTKSPELFDNYDSLNIPDSIKNYVEISQNFFSKPQSPIVKNIEHYRNIYGSPENFIKRQFNYEKMKVFDEKFRKELERKASFKSFPKDLEHLISPMAKSGFYYTGNKAEPCKVKCIFCHGTLYKWSKNDVPNKGHKKAYPTCPFLLNLNVGNIPVEENGENILSKDPDLKCGDKILFNVFSTSDDIFFINTESVGDFEKKLKTFENFEYLKEFVFENLYIIEKENINYIKCSDCGREIEILKNVEKLSHDVFHETDCSFFKLIKSNFHNGNLFINKPSNEIIKTRNYFKVEYSITDEEIEARMDNRIVHKLKEFGHDRDKIKKVITNRLKITGKDYESILEMMLDIKDYNYVPNFELNILDFVFQDYLCSVCLENIISIIFLPCGHFKTCKRCSDSLLICPVCKKLILKKVSGIRLRDID